MSWKNEIVRAMFVAFGALQIFTNLSYLILSNGRALARKQHRELPDNVTDKQVVVKIICMLILGLLFLGTGMTSYFSRSYYELSFIIALCVFVVYAIAQAIYYRFWKTYGELALALVLFALVVFI